MVRFPPPNPLSTPVLAANLKMLKWLFCYTQQNTLLSMGAKGGGAGRMAGWRSLLRKEDAAFCAFVLALACWCEFILQTITVKKHVYIAQIYQKPHTHTHWHMKVSPAVTLCCPLGGPPQNVLDSPYKNIYIYMCISVCARGLGQVETSCQGSHSHIRAECRK